ncbi:RNA-directed DNA polymerase, eukaryota, reverse transcriptase zinc-binding domain protein [Tanacetum coccineum]
MGYEMNAPGKSVDSFEEGEIIGESDDGCVKDCMGKKLDDDVEKDIEDCSNNVTEKCGVVNNNMSNNVEGEILEDHFDGDRGNDTIEDNADVNPSTNVSLKVNIPKSCKWCLACVSIYASRCLDKAEQKKIHVWMKMMNVPMKAWSVKGISALASSIGKPIIMDEITSMMCVTRVGRIGFARVLVEIDAEKGIKDKFEIMYKSKNIAEGTKKIMNVEYSWIPCICSHCKVFGHTDSYCKSKSKNVIDDDSVKTNENEFKVMQNGKYGREGFNMNKRTNMRRREDEGKGKDIDVNRGKDIEANVMNTNNEKASGGSMKKKDGEKVYKEGSTSMENSNEKEMLGSNRFTFLDSLINEEELIPNTNQRKIVDEFLSRKNDDNNVEMNGWNEDIKSQKNCTVIYVSNSRMERRKLWKDLEIQKIITGGIPWVILGDFNATLKVSEHSNGSANPSSEMSDFQECVNSIEIDDLHSEGFHYTWTKSLKNPKCKTLKKLDRIMVNEAFIDTFQQAYGVFLPYMISGHSSIIVRIPNGVQKRKGSFRFSNFITDKEDFLPTIRSLWNKRFEGHTMYRVVQKMKALKRKLKQLSWKIGMFLKGLRSRKKMKESKKDLKEGDRNTAYFYKTIKEMSHRGRIMTIRNKEGVRFENDDVSVQIVKYFEEFLGKSSQVQKLSYRNDILLNKLTSEEALKMVRPISDSEIKNVMFEIEDSKAPGPDGYTSRFYRLAWSIVEKEVCQAVREFSTGKLLGEVNATLILLVPKIPTTDKLVEIIKKTLDEFSGYSSLLPNMQKSTVFFGGLSNAGRQNILNIIPFTVGKLPARYLGVPLITKQISELTKGKAKVSWDAICKPKDQRGLGLKNLGVWNEVLMLKYLWNVASKKDTLWVKCIYVEKIKGRSIWEVQCENKSSVGWKNILSLKDKARRHIWWKIGNGKSVNVWHDRWCPVSPLTKFIDTRDIYDARLNNTCIVSGIIHEGRWSIPRHAFVTCLAIQKRLMTQEKLLIWRPNEDLKCALCNKCPDSHNHLFFTCEFSSGVCNELLKMLNVRLSGYWDQIIIEMKALPSKRNIRSIVRMIVCGAVVYYIWQERNNIIFKNEKRDRNIILNMVKETVGMKLIGIKVKESRNVKEVEKRYNIKMQRG